jgi:glycosyltransferase involved in cell wall biosynthesis
MVGREIVCFANDWSADPTSKHQIMRRMAGRNRILWAEAGGMRAPQIGRSEDWHRILRKAGSLLRSAQSGVQGLHVYSVPALPFPASRIAGVVNRYLYRAMLSRQLQHLGFSSAPIHWVFAPHVTPYIKHMRRSLLVYHCVDRWSAFRDYSAERMTAWETQLLGEADVVIASALDLVGHCERHSRRVHYVPHGVDVAHFAAALDPGPLPEELRAIPEPRVGFFGLIHEWIDLGLIRQLADRTGYSFVLIGETRADLGELRSHPGIYLLGRRPYERLPEYCRGFQAAVIPFRTNSLTRSVNPIKLREYAAAGLPIVSSDLPEVRRCSDIAYCASDVESWVTGLTEAVKRGGDERERRAQVDRVRPQDWSVICGQIGEIIDRTSAVAPRDW